MATNGKWAFIKHGTKKELLKLQKSYIGRKTQIVPTKIVEVERATVMPFIKKTFKLELWVE
jgi:hypothetical protein